MKTDKEQQYSAPLCEVIALELDGAFLQTSSPGFEDGGDLFSIF